MYSVHVLFAQLVCNFTSVYFSGNDLRSAHAHVGYGSVCLCLYLCLCLCVTNILTALEVYNYSKIN